MKRIYQRQSIQRLSAWVLIQALVVSPIVPSFAFAEQTDTLKVEAAFEGTARPGLGNRLLTPTQSPDEDKLTAGLEELPDSANPLSEAFAPERYVISSPMIPPPQGEAVLPMEVVTPAQVRQLVASGKRVVLRTRLERVGERLWDKQADQQELQYLYRIVYDIAEGGTSLTPQEITQVIELLNHPSQAIAAAARDVIVKARVHGLPETVRGLARGYQQRQTRIPPGPYADHYFKDAMTARLDFTHRMELGSPETPIFAGEMTEQRMHEIHERLKRWVDPEKSLLSQLTGSGQRMAAPIGLVEAGLREEGFPAQEMMVDIGSQPHDLVKVLFGLVAKRFVENMPKWREEFGRNDKEKKMPSQWNIAIGMDPRSTGPAIFQVAARVFQKMGVGVKFIGITSAPEAAARALLSDPGENLLASYEITPSHIPQGFQGTKLMLWTGQILPWARAEEFNKQIRSAVQDFNEVRQVMEWLQDPALNGPVDQILQRMPQEYADSKRRYHRYLEQLFVGSSKTGQEVEDRVAQLSEELNRLGITVVIDANGGARITDLPFYDRLFGGYIVIGANAAEFAHSLPPGEISSRNLIEFAEGVAPAFDQDRISLILVNPDPDGDRKGIVYRAPSGEFLYLDPQAGYLLDVLNHVLSAEENKVSGIGVVANEATTIVAKILADRLGFKFLITETGEANVVQGMNRLIRELQEQHPGDVSVMGGEGSAAATISGDVQVRDMVQGIVSMVNFARNPNRVKRLIDLLVEEEQEKKRLLEKVEREWYQPGQIQYLVYHIVHEILPPMRNTDPGYDTEVLHGVGIQDQKPFKDTADRLLAPEGEWVKRFREETADVLQVPLDRIRISEPINSIEDYQIPVAGKRTLPDKRTIHDGGYEIQAFYREPSGKEHYLYKLEFRRSKTQIGDTRRMVFATVTFLQRAEAELLLDRLYERIYSLWLAFLNDLEAEELIGHLKGDFGPVQPSLVQSLTGLLDHLLSNTWQARKGRVEQLTDPAKSTYSKVDVGNIKEQDAAVEGAMARLAALLNEMDQPMKELHTLAAEMRENNQTRVTEDQQSRLIAARQFLEKSPQFSVPPISSKNRNDLANTMAQDLVSKIFRWKMNRLLGGWDFSLTQDVLARIDRLGQIMDDLHDFALRKAAAENPRQGVAFSNLVNAKIILSKEVDFTQAAAGMEEQFKPLGEAVPLDQVPVFPSNARPDFGSAPFVFISLMAGQAIRWQESIEEAGRQEEFAARTDPRTGQATEILSKGLVPLKNVPGFPAGTELPVGWLPVSASLALGGMVITVVGHQKDLVMDRFTQLDAQKKVSYVEQTNRDGTGGAVWRALAAGNLQGLADKPVIIASGDQPLLDANVFKDILRALEKTDLVVGTSVVKDPKDKGRIVRSRKNGLILEILEQKEISDAITKGKPFPQKYHDAGYESWQELDGIHETNTGVYGVRVSLMRQFLSGILNKNAQNQYYATDMVAEALKKGKIVAGIDVPAWKMPDVTRIGDLEVVVNTLRDRAEELKFTAGLEEGKNWTATEWKLALEQADQILRTFPPDLTLSRGMSVLVVLKNRYGSDSEKLKKEVDRRLNLLGKFTSQFGDRDEPVQFIVVPARVDLMGNHWDYNGGPQLVSTLDRDSLALVRARSDSEVHITSTLFPSEPVVFDPRKKLGGLNGGLPNRKKPLRKEDWADYAMAACAYWLNEWLKADSSVKWNGFEGIFDTSAPLGMGLATSSSFLTAAAIAFHELNGKEWESDRRSFAAGCGRAEWLRGTRGGWSDHLAALMGKKGHLIVAYPDEEPQYFKLPAGWNFVIISSGVSRRMAGTALPWFNQRSAETNLFGRVLFGQLLKEELGKISKEKAEQIQKEWSLWELIDFGMKNGLDEEKLSGMVAELPDSLTERVDGTRYSALFRQVEQNYPGLRNKVARSTYYVRNRVLYMVRNYVRMKRISSLLEKESFDDFGELMARELKDLIDLYRVLDYPAIQEFLTPILSLVDVDGRVNWTGGGFGGAAVALLSKGCSLDDFRDQMKELDYFKRKTKLRQALLDGRALFVVQPTPGAEVEKPWRFEKNDSEATSGLEEWERRIEDYYQDATVAVLGGRGFVGGRYLDRLLDRYGPMVGRVKAVTTQDPDRLREQISALPGARKLEPIQGDHLVLGDVRKLIQGAKIIIDTAGLAWQHLPGGRSTSLEDELLQNSLSAALIGYALEPGQRLLWTSSSASDYMFARLTKPEQYQLWKEIDRRARAYVEWIRSLGNTVPAREQLLAFIADDLNSHPPQSFLDGPESSVQKTVVYARAFSYPYSKLLGQRILEIIGQGGKKDIRVLKISDVYGPGQGLGPMVWNPRHKPNPQAARRPQWFLAVYEAIREGRYRPWMRKQPEGKGPEGGFRKVSGQIQQEILDDYAAPTHIDDVVEMLYRASAIELPTQPEPQVVLSVSAPWIPNVEMAKQISNVVGVKVLGKEIEVVPGRQVLRDKPPSASEDLAFLGMQGRLVPFQEGIARQLAWWRQTRSFAGLEEKIQLAPGAALKRVIFVGPEVATGELFRGLARFRPAGGEKLGWVVFARDAAHKQEIEAGLEEAGLEALEPVVDVSASPYNGNPHAAIADFQLKYWGRGNEIHVLLTLFNLAGLGPFLKIEDVSFRSWLERLDLQLEAYYQ
ncbi:MAG: hypothetical protein HY211_00615 [Candidatus Omnitrophica bacterium]|nr:hypothetical protein [Candidatus Omnitrophota bacterium]